MDELLAREIRAGAWVLYRDALHKVVDIAPAPGPPNMKLQGPYAADTYISYTLLVFPVLRNPPATES